MKNIPIPHMFYLRRVRLGKRGNKSLYIYYDYRDINTGTVYAHSREEAKRKVRFQFSTADFWR